MRGDGGEGNSPITLEVYVKLKEKETGLGRETLCGNMRHDETLLTFKGQENQKREIQ